MLLSLQKYTPSYILFKYRNTLKIIWHQSSSERYKWHILQDSTKKWYDDGLIQTLRLWEKPPKIYQTKNTVNQKTRTSVFFTARHQGNTKPHSTGKQPNFCRTSLKRSKNQLIQTNSGKNFNYYTNQIKKIWLSKMERYGEIISKNDIAQQKFKTLIKMKELINCTIRKDRFKRIKTP